MQKYIVTLVFSLLPCFAFAQQTRFDNLGIKQPQHTVSPITTYHLSTSKSKLNPKNALRRSINYPTQIVRLKLNFSRLNVSCEDVAESMHRLLLDKLQREEFFWAAGSVCWASVDGDKPDTYSFDIYFDPLTDEAIHSLEHYIEQYNGTDFYGVPFIVESAKGVVVWLDVNSGIEENADSESSHFTTLSTLNGRLYFDSTYDFNNTLSKDIENNMLTNDPILITTFIKKWIISGNPFDQAPDYLQKLASHNKVIISPQFIFLMDNEPKAHSTSVYTTYTHDCTMYPSGKCLG